MTATRYCQRRGCGRVLVQGYQGPQAFAARKYCSKPCSIQARQAERRVSGDRARKAPVQA